MGVIIEIPLAGFVVSGDFCTLQASSHDHHFCSIYIIDGFNPKPTKAVPSGAELRCESRPGVLF